MLELRVFLQGRRALVFVEVVGTLFMPDPVAESKPSRFGSLGVSIGGLNS